MPPSDVFSRLTNTSTYTGTHKEKLNALKKAEKPISIILFRNGDKNDQGYKLMVKNFRTFDQVLRCATENVKLITGPVKKIYKSDLKTRIRSIDEFQDGECYLCCSGEAPNPGRLPTAMKVENQ
ncbi:hypothetical protein ROZALSC1DRAFT_28491 [Rozella allomycis CSF55]|uniref:Doublecortin domain-containing protein n=1 Tax=Rozella allomycis (strain CSF55) TaxID=988480 RepID=A0A4P9YKH6_ROZAC|nr:hypothetical protein ROZALSC1DRAFT_28491 [Rozella allomycis CSF55]